MSAQNHYNHNKTALIAVVILGVVMFVLSFI